MTILFTSHVTHKEVYKVNRGFFYLICQITTSFNYRPRKVKCLVVALSIIAQSLLKNEFLNVVASQKKNVRVKIIFQNMRKLAEFFHIHRTGSSVPTGVGLHSTVAHYQLEEVFTLHSTVAHYQLKEVITPQ